MADRPNAPNLESPAGTSLGVPGVPKFESRFTEQLPPDPEASNFLRQVSGACYSRVLPTRVAQPRLIAHSREVAELLELPAGFSASAEFAEVMGGNRLLEGMDPYAHVLRRPPVRQLGRPAR